MSNGTITKLLDTTIAVGANMSKPTLDLLTAMGHGNGSGTTEEFVTIPGHPRTYNAANFDGATDEAKINAMIAKAVLDGATATNPRIGFIPASMQPYDASAVTFNDAVHMVAEGTSQSLNEWHVVAYGGDFNGDSYAAANAAADAIAASGSGGDLVFPGGLTNISKPLRIKAKGIGIHGVGHSKFNSLAHQSKLQGTFGHGPLLFLGDWTIPTVASSLPGGGSALRLASDAAGWFMLRDAKTMDVDGFSAFSAEWYGSFDTLTGSVSRMCLSSRGQWMSGDTASECFQLLVQGMGGSNTRLSCTLVTSNGSFVVNAANNTVSAAQLHHLSFTYDGATLRLFRDGVLEGSTAATGTVKQQPEEDVFLGPKGQTTPEGFSGWVNGFGTTGGTCEWVRFSNSARWTSGFTPPSDKPASDANSILLMTFDLQIGPLTRAYTTSGDAYLFHRGQTAFGGAVNTGSAGSACHVHDLALIDNTTHIGIVVGYNANQVRLSRVRGSELRVGAIVSSNSFFFEWDDCLFQCSNAAGRYGVILGDNSSYMQVDSLTTVNYLVGLACSGAHGIFNNANILTGATTHIGVLLMATGVHQVWTFNNLYVDTEVGTHVDWRGSIAASSRGVGPAVLNLLGGTIEISRAKPNLLFGGWTTGTCTGTEFDVMTGQSAVMSLLSGQEMGSSVLFTKCPLRNASGNWIPWSDKAGTAVVGKLGKLSAVTFSVTPTFACDARDEFEITLTDDCAPTITNVTPGQSILITIIQDGAGAHAFTWPGNVKGGGTISATGGSVNQQRFTAMLDSETNPTLMADAAMVSV